ncbi:PREDICTED: uncharacterized protein LOC103326503 [Prunus mume]|uniref:Uncharacterized protein LOC103326503 n=1 Tax=Prunus mume TaxID=102107 RepID=A0ABM0NMD8_PRUMU|nr:PREDICTED: uncharacterized protein LOC103326503 [Prunus mume]
MTDKAINRMLGMMKKMCPKPNNVLESFYVCKKMLKGLGLGYKNIDACVYDCALFYQEHEKKDKCPVCNEPRYKDSDYKQIKKVPRKVMRYFPLKPRLQRLFMSRHTANDMRWHKDKRLNDENKMRHPADSIAWKEFDKMYLNFAQDPRNVRLGLATDGFNPFGNMSTSYSMWPVVLFPYNLPAWKCMKKPYSMMTLLVLEPKAPGKELDVYLRSLVDELKELWENGIQTYDKMSESTFNMHAAVMWTINDFPAYGNLSRWSTHGRLACPVCNEDTSYTRLRVKSKDTLKARLDLQNMNIRKNLQMKLNDGNKLDKPPANQYITNVIVDEGKISGLKSHDFHVLMQHVLPLGIRKHLKKQICEPLVELSSFFQQICAKTLTVTDLDKLEESIVIILCKLEKIFPPAFFNAMVHVAIHLPCEAKLAGPVGCRWMYLVERLLGTYKKYVRNKAQPEGSIAEAYIAYESSTFCSMYLCDVETELTRPERNSDGGDPSAKLLVFAQKARPFGGHLMVEMSKEDMEVAYWYILDNCDEIEDFRNKHIELLERESHDNLQRRHRKLFPEWFRHKATTLYNQEPRLVSEEIFALAQGPDLRTVQYIGCVVNGIQYLVAHVDRNCTTQNSRVMTPGSHNGEGCEFYGSLINVIKVQFKRGFKVVLFKCRWYNTDAKCKKVIHDYNLTSVNINSQWYGSDPYVLATQAHQVFYMDDLKLGHPWRVVQRIQHRYVWDVPERDDDEEDDDEDDDDDYNGEIRLVEGDDDEASISLCRDNVDPESIDTNNDEVRRMLASNDDDDDDDDDDDNNELQLGYYDNSATSEGYSDLD